jgi:putative DNA primase/helicase
MGATRVGRTVTAVDWSGARRQACPSCARGLKDKALAVTVDDRGGVAFCHRCQYVETMHDEGPLQRPGRPVVRSAAPIRHECLSEFGSALWASCRPLAGEALAYLEARRCVIPPADGDLRWHRALRHPPSGMVGPALVALVTDAVTGTPMSLHRTWIQADGTKAPLDPPRMLLGGHRKAGGLIRLWPDEAVVYGLGLAEGVETALSMARHYAPVWSAIDAGNLAVLPVLAGIEYLVIGADHDEAGLKAATACADRWAAAGVEVHVIAPDRAGADWNERPAA